MRCVCERFSGSSCSVRQWTKCCSWSTAPLEGRSRGCLPCPSVWREWPACCSMGCIARQFTFLQIIINPLSVSKCSADHRLFSLSSNQDSLSACRNFNLKEALESVNSQISCEINKSLTERSYPALTPDLQASLRGQICSLTQKDNPIRTLVGKISKQE